MAGNMNVHSLLSVMTPNSAVLTLCVVLSWTWRTASPHAVVGARNTGPFHSAVQDIPSPATTPAATTSLSSSDDSDDLVDAELIRMMRLEMIKQKILQKLGLSAPPQITTNTADLPEPIKHSVLLGRDVGEDWGMIGDGPAHQHHHHHRSRHSHSRPGNDNEPRQIISLAEEVRDCPENQQATCFSVSLDPKTRRYHMESTQIWLYVKPNTNKTEETIGLVERTPQGVKFLKNAEVRVSQYEGWVQIDIRKSLLNRLSSGTQPTWVEVMCRTCERGSSVSIARLKHLKPFVVVTMRKDEPTSQLRGRRSLRPRNRYGHYNPCCHRRPFIVNFTEIELDFIIFPSQYDAGYCEGSCAATGCLPQRPAQVTATYPREVLLRRYHGLNLRPVIPSCCAPSAKSKHSLILHTLEHRIVTEHLQDMIVTECECVF